MENFAAKTYHPGLDLGNVVGSAVRIYPPGIVMGMIWVLLPTSLGSDITGFIIPCSYLFVRYSISD